MGSEGISVLLSAAAFVVACATFYLAVARSAEVRLDVMPSDALSFDILLHAEQEGRGSYIWTDVTVWFYAYNAGARAGILQGITCMPVPLIENGEFLLDPPYRVRFRSLAVSGHGGGREELLLPRVVEARSTLAVGLTMRFEVNENRVQAAIDHLERDGLRFLHKYTVLQTRLVGQPKQATRGPRVIALPASHLALAVRVGSAEREGTSRG